MGELNMTNKMLAQMALAVLLLATLAAKQPNVEALALKQTNANSFPNRASYPIQKAAANQAVPQRAKESKPGPVIVPSILSDYYNTLLTNSAQNTPRLPVQNWPQQEMPYIPYANVGDNDYETNADEYYSDDNSETLRSAANDIIYGNDVYQPEGWFNGPVVLDNADTNAETDDNNDEQLNTLMMAYLLDQFDKLNQLKSLSEKRNVESKREKQEEVVTSSLPSVTTTPPPAKITTNAIPKKLTAKQIRIQRGQKEFPLLRPAAENDEKTVDTSHSDWPSELDETNLSQEDSLMSLRQQSRGQTRTVRDVLTAQLDSLKKEGPKMH